MTEQEQIEEITKYVDDLWIDYPPSPKEVAEALCNEGYRKVPDGSVVLTKEEYERFKTSRNIRVITKYEEDDYEVCIPASDYDEIFKQERKETAKEFAKKFKECKTIKELVELGYIASYVDVCNEIDGLLKEYNND